MSNDQLTCLRCKHCKLLPETNMEQTMPVIYCAIKKDKSPLILSGCGLPDPRPYDVREKKIKTWRDKVGDKLKHAGEVEEAWLLSNYWDATWERITGATMRSRLTLVSMGRHRGWKRSPRAIRYKPEYPKQARQGSGMIFNDQQSAYILDCYDRDFWPEICRNSTESGLLFNQGIRDVIVPEVNRLGDNGKTWTWESVRRHVRWKSPSYQRDIGKMNRIKRERQKGADAECR